MPAEENIKQELISRFPFLEGKVNILRSRRISLEIDKQNFPEVFDFAVKSLKFGMLSAITGLDEGENLGFIYHLAREDGNVLNIKISAPKANPAIGSVTDYFPSADIYEREVVDLFGAKVEGLAQGSRYPLTDDWPKGEFPLRKDWKVKDDSVKSTPEV